MTTELIASRGVNFAHSPSSPHVHILHSSLFSLHSAISTLHSSVFTLESPHLTLQTSPSVRSWEICCCVYNLQLVSQRARSVSLSWIMDQLALKTVTLLATLPLPPLLPF